MRRVFFYCFFYRRKRGPKHTRGRGGMRRSRSTASKLTLSLNEKTSSAMTTALTDSPESLKLFPILPDGASTMPHNDDRLRACRGAARPSCEGGVLAKWGLSTNIPQNIEQVFIDLFAPREYDATGGNAIMR
jgi:hypothetical protein